jgi:ribosomal protein L37E
MMERAEPAYAGRLAALASCHGKDAAIAPAFRQWAGLDVRVPDGIDTDRLGTFTGEVPRPGSMAETARLKAEMGMKAAGLSLGIASEGSFGPHPVMPFLAAAQELLLFADAERGIEVIETGLSEDTNFAVLDIVPGADLDAFLARVRFPDHAIVVRADTRISKGIRSRPDLDRLIAEGVDAGEVRIETDMRAHMNPTRMGQIATLAERLARRIATPCPACGTPGFGRIRTEAGLPCAECGVKTRLVRSIIEGCARCGYERETPRPDGRTEASPAECDLCNP